MLLHGVRMLLAVKSTKQQKNAIRCLLKKYRYKKVSFAHLGHRNDELRPGTMAFIERIELNSMTFRQSLNTARLP